MRKITFLAYKGYSISSKLIKWRTRGDYSHIGILLDEENDIFYNNKNINIKIKGRFFYEAWQTKGVIRNINQPLVNHKTNTIIDRFTLEVDEKIYIKVEEFLDSQVGKGYDWKAIWSFKSNGNKQNPNKWFCSELANAVFFICIGQDPTDEKKLISPQRFVERVSFYIKCLELEQKKLEKLNEMIDVQCTDGNWNYSPYMLGMANGMIFSKSLLVNKEPEYLTAPENWLENNKDINKKSKTFFTLESMNIATTGVIQ